jgi:hypothetical protein
MRPAAVLIQHTGCDRERRVLLMAESPTFGIRLVKALIEAANGGGAVVGPFAIGICVMDVKTKARA